MESIFPREAVESYQLSQFFPKAQVMTLCCIKHTLCSCPYSERVFSRPNSRRRTTGHSECIVCVQSDHDERAQRGWLELTPAFTAGCSQPRRVWCLFPWRQRAAAQSWHEADGLVHTRAHLSLSLSHSLCLNVFLSLSVTAHICWYNAFLQSAQACKRNSNTLLHWLQTGRVSPHTRDIK